MTAHTFTQIAFVLSFSVAMAIIIFSPWTVGRRLGWIPRAGLKAILFRFSMLNCAFFGMWLFPGLPGVAIFLNFVPPGIFLALFWATFTKGVSHA